MQEPLWSAQRRSMIDGMAESVERVEQEEAEAPDVEGMPKEGEPE